jgi:hypothetical protein
MHGSQRKVDPCQPALLIGIVQEPSGWKRRRLPPPIGAIPEDPSLDENPECRGFFVPRLSLVRRGAQRVQAAEISDKPVWQLIGCDFIFDRSVFRMIDIRERIRRSHPFREI